MHRALPTPQFFVRAALGLAVTTLALTSNVLLRNVKILRMHEAHRIESDARSADRTQDQNQPEIVISQDCNVHGMTSVTTQGWSPNAELNSGKC
jgi:hypothetical protein